MRPMFPFPQILPLRGRWIAKGETEGAAHQGGYGPTASKPPQSA
jgi:hypothetical protein